MSTYPTKLGIKPANKVVTYKDLFVLKNQFYAQPETVISISGRRKDKSGPIYFREKTAQNSVVAGTDVMVNNFFFARMNTQSDSGIQTVSDLPNTNQGPQGICFMMPFLNMIQSQLDFPMDYNKFLECLSPSGNGSSRESDEYDNLDPELKNSANRACEADIRWNETHPNSTTNRDCDYHKKFATLLYSKKCFPVYESLSRDPLCGDEDSEETVKNPINKECSRCPKEHIKIQFISHDRAAYYKDLCETISTYGPQYLALEDNLYLKIYLMHLHNDTFDRFDAMSREELIELIPEDKRESVIEDSEIGHAVTITNCEGPDENNNYTFTIRNSWGTSSTTNNFQITRKEVTGPTESEEAMDLLLGVIDIVGGFESHKTSIKITKCTDIIESPNDTNCNQDSRCKELGYDKAKNPIENNEDCPCECETVVNNLNMSITKQFKNELTGIYKCECPFDMCPPEYSPNPFALTTTCDCKPDFGTWCMPGNECMDGNYEEYLSMVNQGASDWINWMDANLTCDGGDIPGGGIGIPADKRECGPVSTPTPSSSEGSGSGSDGLIPTPTPSIEGSGSSTYGSESDSSSSSSFYF